MKMNINGMCIRLHLKHGISLVNDVVCIVESVNQYGWFLRVAVTGNYKSEEWVKGSLRFISHTCPLQFTVMEE